MDLEKQLGGTEQTNALPDIFQEMADTIEAMETYAQARGELGGFSTGFKELDNSLEGLNTGLILIGGQSNIGKSAYCLQMAWQVAERNTEVSRLCPNKAYVIYFSLDDNSKDLLPRVIAMNARIKINVARTPNKYRSDPTFGSREKGLAALRDSVRNFKMFDSSKGTNLEFIESEIKRHSDALKEIDKTYKLAVFIDNFHDITTEKPYKDLNERYDYIAGELTRLATAYDIPIVCTAEFRKLNGTRRPMMDDVRESVKIMYEAKAALLCYNEVGMRGSQANVYWNVPDNPDAKLPVFEVHVAKNKFGSYKGRIFYQFYADQSFMQEADLPTSQNYMRMM